MKKENIYKLLCILVMVLVLGFVITLALDAYNLYFKNSENLNLFTSYILVRLLEFIVPASIILLISKYLEKEIKQDKSKNNKVNKTKIKKVKEEKINKNKENKSSKK